MSTAAASTGSASLPVPATGFAEFDETLATVPLVDHHAHGALLASPTAAEFEGFINEGLPGIPPAAMTPWDSQLGFAIRRWCAPLLGAEPSADPEAYWAARSALPEQEVSRRLLTVAGVSDWLIDTGFSEYVLEPAQMAAIAGRAYEIVRLETLAERVITAIGSGGDYAAALTTRLREATAQAVGVKSVLAYRGGFDIDLSRPADTDVATAAQRWLDGLADGRPPRLVDVTLLRFGLHAALERGLPVQFHVGFGDRDTDLRRGNPLHLRDYLFAAEAADVPVMLLHNYPFEREAGYLAQAFRTVYIDAGLAINYSGARSPAVIARTLELAPFGKVLYSGDAWGPAELHYLGSLLWRRGMAAVIGPWLHSGEWSERDAVRITTMMARTNALRAYGLD